MRYGYFGSMKTKPGHRDQVVQLLLRSAEGLRSAGCHHYVIGVSDDDDQTIWVNEVWDTREAHDASLHLPDTQAAIAAAMPLLTGEFTSREITVLGGLGLPPE
ncbi:putative quinol monooxygenase [Actinoplanes sp. NPDC023801]|uniref:putative quinol monooxygenase n=1 Tax=Actinoplanes sp. NPDC023801 TaxID=3154595 RepID=UPI0033C4195D